MQVKQAIRPGKLADGNGLYLVVDPGGAKRWLQRIVIRGKRRDLGLGSFRLISLSEAREQALLNRKIAREGGDPTERRAAATNIPTFQEAAERVHAEHELAWKNPKHARQWITTLRTYAFPILGKISVTDIATHDVLRVLSPIWLKRPETARRVRQRIGTVMDWAKAAGFRSGDNPIDGVVRGLPKQPTSKKHHAALAFKELPIFIARLRASESGVATKSAFEILIQTATRTNETLSATWAEIDEANAIWTIPAERMKAKRVHRIPLARRPLEILAQLKSTAGDNRYIFAAADSGKPLSNMVFLSMLKRMELRVTAHGFRSAFSDWAAETTNFPREVVEMALAHTVANKVEAAYRRGDLFDKRRELMQAWSDFLN